MESSNTRFEFPITARWLAYKLPPYYEVQHKSTKNEAVAPGRS